MAEKELEGRVIKPFIFYSICSSIWLYLIINIITTCDKVYILLLLFKVYLIFIREGINDGEPEFKCVQRGMETEERENQRGNKLN